MPMKVCLVLFVAQADEEGGGGHPNGSASKALPPS